MTIADIAAAKYVRLTTFTRDGRPKHTPVWIAPMGGNVVGTTTDDDAWKTKRLRNTSDAELSRSDSRGNVAEGELPLTCSARLLDADDTEFRELEAAMVAKYGLQYRLFRFIRRLRNKTPCGIALTLR